MTEERTTVTREADGTTHTHTTIRDDAGRSTGGGGKWVLLLLLAVAIIGGLFIFNQMGGAEAAKDVAVADAAGEVGEAAQQVGNAVENAADEIGGE